MGGRGGRVESTLDSDAGSPQPHGGSGSSSGYRVACKALGDALNRDDSGRRVDER